MSALVKMYTFEQMSDAVIEAVSSEASGHPAEHAVAPLEADFAWEANQASTQHTITVDLGYIKTTDGFSFVHHETEDDDPTIIGIDITAEYSLDATTWVTQALAQHTDGTDSPTDFGDTTIRIKLRHFEDGSSNLESVTARYWRFTVQGLAPPFEYAPSDSRISMIWLFELHQLDRGPTFPVDDQTIFPGGSQIMPFGRTHRCGHSVNPHVFFSRTWMLTSSEYDVIKTVLAKCNGTDKPFIYVENSGKHRLCKFRQDTFAETLLDISLYQVKIQFVELPTVRKDKYH